MVKISYLFRLRQCGAYGNAGDQFQDKFVLNLKFSNFRGTNAKIYVSHGLSVSVHLHIGGQDRMELQFDFRVGKYKNPMSRPPPRLKKNSISSTLARTWPPQILAPPLKSV